MKKTKFLSGMLAALISVHSLLPISSGAAAKGDIYADGILSYEDLTMLQEHVLGRTILDEDRADAADVNGDGVINSLDVAALRRLILDTERELRYTDTVDRYSSGYKDSIKELAPPNHEDPASTAVISSPEQLQESLSDYFSDGIVGGYLNKYDAEFFSRSVLLLKTFYFDAENYLPTYDYELGCGCTTDYAGIYTTKNVDEYMNIRVAHSYNVASIGHIPPNAIMTVYHGNGQWAHVEYGGISGYANMDYMEKISDLPVTYSSVPDIQLDSVCYSDGRVTVSVSEMNAGDAAEFYSALIAQAILPKKEYYAEDTQWAVSTTAPTTTTTTTTTTCPYPLASAKLDKVGWDLKAAFNAAAGIPYYGHTADMPQDANTTMEWYADYGFKNGKGNCYVMAAMFCEMARLLGYEAHQISGKVPLLAGGYGPHSWVEITVNGTVYVCDPNFTNETGRNGYMITYGQSGTWRYSKEIVMS